MEPAAITPETFSFVALFARADWVGKAVMIFL
ncbi:MAG: Tol-Pal system subunit TolQ, partial [Phenylobacterium sp.]|nr:Tol-Pal system subunit TolQ [Phenylobacterium sp.]